VNIRSETREDIEDIRRINIEAFDTDAEAHLVDALRDSGVPLISLVAEAEGDLLGHILFSPVELQSDKPRIAIAGLAPMAVLPELQNKGVGSRLIQEGLKQCASEGYQAVVVLGHAAYYRRFGFLPASQFGIRSQYDVADEVFMILELKNGALKGHKGIVKYHTLFNDI